MIGVELQAEFCVQQTQLPWSNLFAAQEVALAYAEVPFRMPPPLPSNTPANQSMQTGGQISWTR